MYVNEFVISIYRTTCTQHIRQSVMSLLRMLTVCMGNYVDCLQREKEKKEKTRSANELKIYCLR